jgi:hypothetical protein
MNAECCPLMVITVDNKIILLNLNETVQVF